MEQFSSDDYLKRMIPWLNVLPDFLRSPADNPELQYYGTGESAHWPVQSNMNVCAALAVMADDPALPAGKRKELRKTALKLFRYSMRTHLTGDTFASDGKQWGHHWISVLGAERITHGILTLEPFFTNDDRKRYRTFRISESDWLLNEYPIVAGIESSRNKPESNLWNGGFLLRTALDYPDAPRVKEYLNKATGFLLNGISHPSDYGCEKKFRGIPLRKWFVGANFTPNYSLDHHSYLNVGYMVICLSNIAMLHFNIKEKGQTAPPELYHHAEDLWKIVKQFLYPDGRLLRIGGDTRARYAYCQCYAIPMWLMAGNLFGDQDAAVFEKNWLNILDLELRYSGDGSCYTKRLESIRKFSHYYFCRLESDHILSLSYGAYWRRKFPIPIPKMTAKLNHDCTWEDDYHNAVMIRKGNAVRSWVRAGAQGATGLCVPLNQSSFGEWQGNMNGCIIGNRITEENAKGIQILRDESFLYTGCCDLVERLPLGEGEECYPAARRESAVAALPDGKTMLIAERCIVTKEVTLHGIFSMNLQIPNDVFNGFQRICRGIKFQSKLTTPQTPEKPGIIDTEETRLNVDDQLSVFLLHGGKSIRIYRSGRRNIRLREDSPPEMDSLYADVFCIDAMDETRRYPAGSILFDTVYAVSADTDRNAMLNWKGSCKKIGDERRIKLEGMDGKRYEFKVCYRNNEIPNLEAINSEG